MSTMLAINQFPETAILETSNITNVKIYHGLIATTIMNLFTQMIFSGSAVFYISVLNSSLNVVITDERLERFRFAYGWTMLIGLTALVSFMATKVMVIATIRNSLDNTLLGLSSVMNIVELLFGSSELLIILYILRLTSIEEELTPLI